MANFDHIHFSAQSDKALADAVNKTESGGKVWAKAIDSMFADGIRAVMLAGEKSGGNPKLREHCRMIVIKGLSADDRSYLDKPVESVDPDKLEGFKMKRKEVQQKVGAYIGYIQRKLTARETAGEKREPRKPRTLEVRIAETCRELIDAIQKSDAPQFDADKVLQNLRAVCTLVS